MALNSATLRTLIHGKLSVSFTVLDADELKKLTDAIAEGVVEHLQANAEIALADNGLDTNGDTLVTNEGTLT